jgi:hypothetical protein
LSVIACTDNVQYYTCCSSEGAVRCGAEADAGVYCYPHPLPLLLYISLHIPFIILILFSQESSTTCVSPAAGTFSCAVPSIYFRVKAAGLCRGDGSQGRPWIWNQYHSCHRYRQYLRRKNRKHCLAAFGWDGHPHPRRRHQQLLWRAPLVQFGLALSPPFSH